MAVNPGDLARQHAASAPTPGAVAGMASDADGAEEAALLEKAHRLINDAMEGR